MKLPRDVKLGLGAVAVVLGGAAVHDVFFTAAAAAPAPSFFMDVQKTAPDGWQAVFRMAGRNGDVKTLFTRTCRYLSKQTTPDLDTAFAATAMPQATISADMDAFQKELPGLWAAARERCAQMEPATPSVQHI